MEFEKLHKGLTNALVIDDKDSSINYHKTSISSSINIFDSLVRQLMEAGSRKTVNDESDLEIIYNQIISTFKASGKLYIPKSIDEISDILNKLIDCLWLHDTNLDWIDFSGIIHVIKKDGTELPLNKFQAGDKNGCYLKFIDSIFPKKLYNHCIIIDNNVCRHIDDQWAVLKDLEYTTFNDIDTISNAVEADNDFDGYNHTYRNINIYKNGKNDFSNYPVFKWLDSINAPLGYKAYMPAAGQMRYIYNYNYLINFALEKINPVPSENNCIPLNKYTNARYWTSTETTDLKMAIIACSSQRSNTMHPKSGRASILPMYLKIND